jgi:hypothetical protein
MSQTNARNRWSRHAFLAVTLTLAAVSTLSAAPILTGTATIREQDDAFPALTDTVAIVAGPEIVAGDSSNIGGTFFGFAGEGIDLGGLSIIINIYGGGDPLQGICPGPTCYRTTGAGSPATFTFSGLAFLPLAELVGVTVTTVNTINIGNSDISGLTASGFTFDFDGMGVLETGENLGTITLTLQVRETQPPAPVPEPASMSLLGIGMAALAARRRLRRGSNRG